MARVGCRGRRPCQHRLGRGSGPVSKCVRWGEAAAVAREQGETSALSLAVHLLWCHLRGRTTTTCRGASIHSAIIHPPTCWASGLPVVRTALATQFCYPPSLLPLHALAPYPSLCYSAHRACLPARLLGHCHHRLLFSLLPPFLLLLLLCPSCSSRLCSFTTLTCSVRRSFFVCQAASKHASFYVSLPPPLHSRLFPGTSSRP